jgi:hypothetical protein
MFVFTIKLKFVVITIIVGYKVLEITWKQVENETFKVHEIEQLY